MTAVAAARGASGVATLADPHHDGSALFVVDVPDDLGGEATVRLRVPRAVSAERVVLRYERDGEPRGAVAVVDEETDTDVWWRVTFPVWNPVTRYRWLLSGGDVGYAWVNGLGRSPNEVTDADDFVLALGSAGPEWHLESVVYEIFPDRFASAGAADGVPDWGLARSWDELPTGRGPETPREWFGGDLRGIERRLDHVEHLGANALYLTPFFPAGSSHRYDSTSFAHVDPLLGDDDALASLTRAAHARGLRVVGDITLNHTGNRHEWFRAAQADPAVPERDFYFFDPALPGGYESWLGIKTLPKLNWASDELRSRMRAVVRRYLEPPFSLDGWRIDVANMVGRYREVDLNRQVSHWMSEVAGDRLLVAEHGHDFRPDLAGRGWHGVMNYSGFLRPVWTWLRAEQPAEELRRQFWGIPVGVPSLEGAEVVAAMRAFRAGIPWSAALHSWTLLDSHDTARFRTVSGSRERHAVGIGLQMTTPGVPMMFAGDELGLEGEWGEDARRTMPWNRPDTWDDALLETYRRLIALRRSSDALARGGLRYVSVRRDAVAFLRETRDERLLVLAARADHEPVRVALGALGSRDLEPLEGGDAAIDGGDAVLPADGPAFHVWRLG